MALVKVRHDTGYTNIDLIGAPVDKGVCGFSDNAVSMLTQRMTDLYTDPVMATVREVISNAVDATMMLPEKDRKPVEVTTPSKLSPQFVVKDHGVGMSLDDVKTHFSQYGESTKEQDLNQIGAYGLGSKAPLAYTNRFTVVTVKDGWRTVFSMERDATSNSYNILAHETTDDDSGTTITVPAALDDSDKFVEYSRKYSKFALDGVPITVDNESSSFQDEWTYVYDFPLDKDKTEYGQVWIKTSEFDEVIKWLLSKIQDGSTCWRVDDYTTSFTQYFSDNAVAVLSGWPYRLSSNYYWHKPSIALVIKPGVVDFSSSRDEITENSRKKAMISRAAGEIDPYAGRTESNKNEFKPNTKALDNLVDSLDDDSFNVIMGSVIKRCLSTNDKIDWNYVLSKRPKITESWLANEKTPRFSRVVSFDCTVKNNDRLKFDYGSLYLASKIGDYEVMMPVNYSRLSAFTNYLDMTLDLKTIDCNSFNLRFNVYSSSKFNQTPYDLTRVKIHDLPKIDHESINSWSYNGWKRVYILTSSSSEKFGSRLRSYASLLNRDNSLHTCRFFVCVVDEINSETKKAFEMAKNEILAEHADGSKHADIEFMVMDEDEIIAESKRIRAKLHPAKTVGKKHRAVVGCRGLHCGSIDDARERAADILFSHTDIDLSTAVNEGADVVVASPDLSTYTYYSMLLRSLVMEDFHPFYIVDAVNLRAAMFEDVKKYDRLYYTAGIPGQVKNYKAMETAKLVSTKEMLIDAIIENPKNSISHRVACHLASSYKANKIAAAVDPDLDLLPLSEDAIGKMLSALFSRVYYSRRVAVSDINEIDRKLSEAFHDDKTVMDMLTVSKVWDSLENSKDTDFFTMSINQMLLTAARTAANIEDVDFSTPQGLGVKNYVLGLISSVRGELSSKN